jgi:hypothetical protein
MCESYDYECGWQEPDVAFTNKEEAERYIVEKNKKITECWREFRALDEKQSKAQEPYLEKMRKKGKWTEDLLVEYRKVNEEFNKKHQEIQDKYGMLGYTPSDEVEFIVHEIDLKKGKVL